MKTFRAYGWTLETQDWFTDVETLTAYMLQQASTFEGRTASHLDASVRSVIIEMGAIDTLTESQRRLMMSMFKLGTNAMALEEETTQIFESKEAALQAKIALTKQSHARKMNALNGQLAKEFAQDKARDLWQTDCEQEIRTGEMTELIWAWMADHPRLLDARPSLPVLRNWITEVAAEFPHAKARGRPKK